MSLTQLISHSPEAVCPKHTRRKEARPGELLAAGLALFVEKGYAATRVEEVASRAGVSKGTLFLYFSSKEELFKAVVRENISSRFPQWSAEVDSFVGSSADLLRHSLQTWWQAVGATNTAGICKLMMSEANNFPELAVFYEKEVIEPGNQLIRRILQRGVSSGEFRPVDLKYAIYTWVAPMIFLMTWNHSFGLCKDAGLQLDPEKYLAVQVETLLNGLLNSSPAPTLKHKTKP